MKVQLKSLSGAFKGTTKGLEGIANALKREEPPHPGPYVPTGFPCYIRIHYEPYDEMEILRIDSNYNMTSIDGYQFMNGNPQTPMGDPSIVPSTGKYYGSNYASGVIAIDFATWTIYTKDSTGDPPSYWTVVLSEGYSAEWVDPSTLPQS